MLTKDDFDQMSARNVLDVIASYCLLYNFDQIQPETYRDTLTNAAERLNTIRNQKWSEWAEDQGLL